MKKSLGNHHETAKKQQETPKKPLEELGKTTHINMSLARLFHCSEYFVLDTVWLNGYIELRIIESTDFYRYCFHKDFRMHSKSEDYWLNFGVRDMYYCSW